MSIQVGLHKGPETKATVIYLGAPGVCLQISDREFGNQMGLFFKGGECWKAQAMAEIWNAREAPEEKGEGQGQIEWDFTGEAPWNPGEHLELIP